VKHLEHKTRVVSVTADRSDPANPIINWTREEVGYFVQFEGSYEALFVGKERPNDLNVGTDVTIYIVPRVKK
jgi:hypothetical protein